MTKKTLGPDEILALLVEHPRRIAAATAGVGARRLRDEPVLGVWSARDALAHLRMLPRKDWSRTAIVTGGGPARERTVLFYAAWLARHEPAHVRHIERAFAHARR